MTFYPIQTAYKGYRFRSRLEARWAVYFDFLNLPWEYEKEGYNLGEGLGYYLPDFWLPLVNMWAEVKPEALSVMEKAKCKRLAAATGHPCLMLIGTPEPKPYWAVTGSLDIPAMNALSEPSELDFAISNFKGYPEAMHRFYVLTDMKGNDEDWWEMFPDTVDASVAARSARFEFGETPKIGGR